MFLKNHAQLQGFAGVGAFFLSKNHAKKTPIQNKKKRHFSKKSSKVTQNQEQASELASQVNQASQAI